MTPRPPRLARALLRRLLPGGVRGASILRDLDQEHGERAARTGRPHRLWYWREAAALSLHYLLAGRAGRPRDRHASQGAMERLVRTVRHACRRVRRSPGFALVAVGTLALGIGATVSIFSVVRAVVLSPLPYEEPASLAAVWERNAARASDRNVVNPGNYRAWRERSTAFRDMATVFFPMGMVVRADGDTEMVPGRLTSYNFFDLLGMEAQVGRLYGPADAEGGSSPIVLSDRYWRRAFGADPAVLGRTLEIDGRSGVVVGVLPPAYVVFGEDADLFAGIPVRGDQANTGRYLNVVARLAEGATVERARDEMVAIAAGLEEEHPDFNGGWSANVVPLQDEVVGNVRTGLWILLGAVGLLLLIACANVANLFLARATERAREMAVRTSLGASRAGLAGQLLAESLLVSFLGAALGVGLAHLGTRAIAGAVPDAFALPRVDAAGLDGTVLLFAVGLAVLTGVLFGTVPALRASDVAPAATLASEGRGPGRGSTRLRSALVVVEVALSVVLLSGAALLGRSFVALTSVDPGIRPERVLTARVTLTGPRYQGSEPDVRFFTEVAERLAAIPGVTAAGGSTWLPLNGPTSATGFYAEDRPLADRRDWPVTDVRNVVGDYFGAMGMRLLRGRTFDGRDREDTRDVVVVNRALVEAVWPDVDPLGRRVRMPWSDPDVPEDLEVVGVVENVRAGGLDAPPRPAIYVPYRQAPWFSAMYLAVRADQDPAPLRGAVEAAVHAVDPAVPVADVALMEDRVARTVARPRITALLMGIFAILAGALAAVGLYGVLAYAVSRRVREIGIRVAMGADRGSVLAMVVREGLVLTGLGLLAGVAAALAAGGALDSLLFGVEATDPASLGAAAVLLLAVATAASAVPAWRATRIAPVDALRIDQV